MSRTSFYILAFVAFCMVAVDKLTLAAPSSISIASAGDTGAGAMASAGDVGTGAFAGTSNMGSGTRGGGVSSSSQPRTQSVLVGTNGDTTILQQNGDKPPKVYKISGSGGSH